MSFTLVVSCESRSTIEKLKQLQSLLGSVSDKGGRKWRGAPVATLMLLHHLILAFPNYYPFVLVFSILLPMPFCFLVYFWYTFHPSIWHCCFSIFVCKVIDKIDCFPRRTIVIDLGGKIYKLHADCNKLLINCFLSLMSVNTEPDLSSA